MRQRKIVSVLFWAVLSGLLFSGGLFGQTRCLPEVIENAFSVPAGFCGDGDFLDLLKFNNGREVMNTADWGRRRVEIIEAWEKEMGRWPAVIEKPAMEYLGGVKRENFTQHKVRVEIAAERQMVDGYLLVPDGGGKKAAVLVVYYDAETGVGLTEKPNRDFALQLARRGFVTLSIGTPDFCSLKPPYRPLYEQKAGEVQLQPLSALGYVSANCCNVLKNLGYVDAERIGVMGHSYGGKWAMFSACLNEDFACGVWSDPGIFFDEERLSVNYWDLWYLGFEAGVKKDRGLPNDSDRARTGAYKRLVEGGHDLHEIQALMAPRPFMVSGGEEDGIERWGGLAEVIKVYELLGYEGMVGMTNRPTHGPTVESNAQIYAFFEYFLGKADGGN